MESRSAVFLSYASDDADTAARICDGLRAAGMEVWFDRNDLRGGDAWDHHIRQQIRMCALFIPVISQQTQARPEGYFRLEWNLAEQRSQMMAPSKAFIVPVCVDETREDRAEVPDAFRRVQWTRLPRGEVSQAFGERVMSLLGGAPAGASPSTVPRYPALVAAPRRGARQVAWVAGLALAVAAIGWLSYRSIAPRPGARTESSTPVAAAASVTGAGAVAPAAPEKSIAVLPFVNMSSDRDQEYFADGLSEELIDHLANNTELKVISRTSSFAFKGKSEDVRTIAAQLGVSHLLEGSVRKSGSQIRITAQLIRAADGQHLWSQTYERKLDDIFKVQDEISTTVAKALNVVMVANSQQDIARPRDIEAYNLMLQGNYFFYRKNRDSTAKALGLYRDAINLDPEYAPAWIMLSQAYAQQGNNAWAPVRESYARAIDAAVKAIRFGPDLAAAHMNLGWARATLDWDWRAARVEFERARALDPGNPRVARGLAFVNDTIYGRLAPETALHREELARNPLDVVQLEKLAFLLQCGGQLEESVATFRTLLHLNPTLAGGYSGLAGSLLLMGRLDEALEETSREVDDGYKSTMLPLIYWAQHRKRESDAVLEKAEARFGATFPYAMAEIHAYRGEGDAAFSWLERAYRDRDVGTVSIRSDPLLRSLRQDPRYTAFLRKMKLLEE